MTLSMIITLAVVVLMIVVIISDKLPFGAPAILAAALLVLLGQADVATAFSGFADKNVIMVMGTMACSAALRKTKLVYDLQRFLSKIASRGGTKTVFLLLLSLMVVKNVVNIHYTLLIIILATIPYNEKLPPSKLLLPALYAPSGWLPSGAVMMIGVIGGLVEGTGMPNTVSVGYYCLAEFLFSMIYLVFALIMYRVLPNRDISENLIADGGDGKMPEFVPTLTKLQQNVVYIGFLALLIIMTFLQKLPGESGYAAGWVIVGLFLCVGALNFKEVCQQAFSPVIIMMASVIGVAATMNNCGLSGYLGDTLAGVIGTPSQFVLVLIFGLAVSICSTFTGASFGSLFIFAPIGISVCMTMGYNPVPLAYMCVKAAWINYIMPIDGMHAMAMGTGKYKLSEYWAFMIPMWVVQMLWSAFAAVTFFN